MTATNPTSGEEFFVLRNLQSHRYTANLSGNADLLTPEWLEYIETRARSYYKAAQDFPAKVDAKDPKALGIIARQHLNCDPFTRNSPECDYAARLTGLWGTDPILWYREAIKNA